MKKTLFLIMMLCPLCMGKTFAGNVLTVNDVNVPKGGQATLEIGCEFDTEYTAFELQISLADGLSLLTDADGYPIIERAFASNHILTGNLLPSNGNYKITCRSMENISFPTNGPLFRVTVVADENLALGAILDGSITSCEFTRTADSNGENLDGIVFNCNITEFRTILDETSTTPPVSAEGVNVRVKRTFKAGEWTTFCLPFSMDAGQTKSVFGEDVRLAAFTGWESTAFDSDDNTTEISVDFSAKDAVEANVPYIVMVTKDIEEFTLDGVNLMPEEEPAVTVGRMNRGTFASFTGSYTPTAVEEECLYVKDGKFHYSDGSAQQLGFRAYFYFQDILTTYGSESEAQIVMLIDGQPTGIQKVDDSREGEADDSPIYDLTGRRLSEKPKSGYYIQNGKKYLVK